MSSSTLRPFTVSNCVCDYLSFSINIITVITLWVTFTFTITITSNLILGYKCPTPQNKMMKHVNYHSLSECVSF